VLAKAESQWDQAERGVLVHKPGAPATCSEVSALSKASLRNPASSWVELKDKSGLGPNLACQSFCIN